MKTRLLAAVLAAVMILPLVPASAFADGSGFSVINGTPESGKDTNHGYITIDKESAAEAEKVEVSVIPNDGCRLKNLTYSPAPKTAADILPDGFPAAETETSGAPAGAWKSATLDQLCYISYDGSQLFFFNEAGDPDKSFGIDTDSALSADGDGNYVYQNGTVTVTFSMQGEGGVLDSVIFADTESAAWNGTYQASACVAAGTMVTLENGEQKPIEDLEIGERIRTFDHEKGEVSSAPVCFIWESKNAANAFTLTFEENVEVTVIEEHGFYDCEENKYVFINVRNAADYIGHRFYHADTGSGIALEKMEILSDRVDAYAVATSKHLNHLADGLLSICDGTFEKIANLFAYDDQMKYDAERKEKDIEEFGLTPPEKVLANKGFNEADYHDYNLQYLDIALGKGLISPEWVEALGEYCAAFNIYDSMPETAPAKEAAAPKLLLMSAAAPTGMLGSAPEPETPDGIIIPADENGKYIFDMPAYNVIVTAEFEEIPVHVHELAKVDGQAASQSAAGWKDHYECRDSADACHMCFEDADGAVPIDDLEAWKAEGGSGYLPKLEEDPGMPPTGDSGNTALWLTLLALSLAGLGTCFALDKKRRARHNG